MMAVDLFCGLGGWAEGFLAEGYDVAGFDIERRPYPGDLVLQDITTLDGSQFKDAAVIVASPPCQEYSYMAMPWTRAKQIAGALCEEVPFPSGYRGSRTLGELNLLFDSCFRLQREASEAAGRHIPMVVENVKGAQPWAGRARAHYGSYYLWGDVDSIGNKIVAGGLRPENVLVVPKTRKGFGGSCLGNERKDPRDVRKMPNGNWGVKHHDSVAAWWRTSYGQFSSCSEARKHASAVIAKIPFPLAQFIAQAFKQGEQKTLEPEAPG